jgi:hypothetical protein
MAEITLSNEQQAIFNLMNETNEHMFITGKAGAGKSVLVEYFKSHTKKRGATVAPTGIAALNVHGSTINSMFRLAFGLQQKHKLSQDDDPKLRTVLVRLQYLIIDEISMLRADMLDAINWRLQDARENDEAFGGVQLIMVGDVFQLPPVVSTSLQQTGYFDTTYKSAYFFDALVWKQASFKIYQLEQVFRQKDPLFKEALNAIREGSHTPAHIATLNTRQGIETPKEGTITLAATNKQVSQINQRKLNQLPGELKEYIATISGSIKENNFPTEEVLQLKKDAQVVFLHNDTDKRYINGTVGIIEGLFDNHIEVKIGDKVHKIDRYTWEEITYQYNEKTKEIEERVTSSFTQYPVRLAWVMTMHKSQGQTYESVAIDLSVPTFAHGQCYVALSRATSLEGLYLTRPIQAKNIIVDPKIKSFMSNVEKITIVEEETTQSQEEQVQVVESTLAIVESEQTEQALLPATIESAPVVVEAAQVETTQEEQTEEMVTVSKDFLQALFLLAMNRAQPKEKKAPATENTGKRGRPASGKADEHGRIRQKWQGTYEQRTLDFLNDISKVTGMDKSRFVESAIQATPEYKAWSMLNPEVEDEQPDPDDDPNGGIEAPAQETTNESADSAIESVDTPVAVPANVLDMSAYRKHIPELAEQWTTNLAENRATMGVAASISAETIDITQPIHSARKTRTRRQ